MGNFFSSLIGYALMSLYFILPLGWVYWLWVAVKIGGFAMFALALFPFTSPVAAVLGGWSFLFGIPDWVQSVFIS